MNKLLIIGEFPAPYRVEVFADLAKHWSSKVYFEYQQDEKRTAEWLSRVSVDCNILDNPSAKKEFKQDIKNLKSYDAVILYNNCLKNAIILEFYVADHHMENVTFIPYQDKADLIYSLNAGDVHWCVNAKGIKGVSCPSKYYGLASAARPVIGVLESGSEIRCIIEDTKGGLCCEPGEYDKVEENIRWFIDNAGSEELKALGARSRENLEKNLTRNVSVQKYAEEILKL